jgi:hypothetical protein
LFGLFIKPETEGVTMGSWSTGAINMMKRGQRVPGASRKAGEKIVAKM